MAIKKEGSATVPSPIAASDRAEEPGLPEPKLRLDDGPLHILYFAAGRARIVGENVQLIARLLPAARQAERVEVRGFADATGTPGANRIVARARAVQTHTALVTGGVLPSRIAVRYRTDFFFADNDCETGRQANRRVQVRLIGLPARAASGE